MQMTDNLKDTAKHSKETEISEVLGCKLVPAACHTVTGTTADALTGGVIIMKR
jgi:hypothetical protein